MADEKLHADMSQQDAFNMVSRSKVTPSSNERVAISAEGSELMMELFNRMPIESLGSVPEPIAKRIGDFMVANGYRIVFNRWYLQADPKAPERSADETTDWQAEIEGALDLLGEHAIRVREGGGPENLAASLALTFAKLDPKCSRSSEEPEPRHTGIVHAGGPHTIHEGSRDDCAICSSLKASDDWRNNIRGPDNDEGHS